MFENYKRFIEENRDVLVTKEYYILYVDILGYKNLIDTDETFIYKVKYFLSVIVKEKLDSYKNSRFIYQMFSDNFILALPVEENKALERIVNFASRIQSMVMFHLGILIRGSITKGSIYMDSDLVFGEGLVKAYLLECEHSNFPRIIIDKELYTENYIKESAHRIIQYKDEYKFVNYLHFYFEESTNESLSRQEQIKMIHDCVQEMKNVARDQKILEKIDWTDDFNKHILGCQGVIEYYK